MLPGCMQHRLPKGVVMSCATTRTTCPYCGVGCGVLATRTLDGPQHDEGPVEQRERLAESALPPRM